MVHNKNKKDVRQITMDDTPNIDERLRSWINDSPTKHTTWSGLDRFGKQLVRAAFSTGMMEGYELSGAARLSQERAAAYKRVLAMVDKENK